MSKEVDYDELLKIYNDCRIIDIYKYSGKYLIIWISIFIYMCAICLVVTYSIKYNISSFKLILQYLIPLYGIVGLIIYFIHKSIKKIFLKDFPVYEKDILKTKSLNSLRIILFHYKCKDINFDKNKVLGFINLDIERSHINIFKNPLMAILISIGLILFDNIYEYGLDSVNDKIYFIMLSVVLFISCIIFMDLIFTMIKTKEMYFHEFKNFISRDNKFKVKSKIKVF